MHSNYGLSRFQQTKLLSISSDICRSVEWMLLEYFIKYIRMVY